MANFHDYSLRSIAGETIDLSKYKGRYVLLVNVASACGYTPQYADLQEFHKKYSDKVAVLGIPANNFGAQEPGSNEEIQQFCEVNFGVSFDMFAKIDVVGSKRDALYTWLAEASGKEPAWNFSKYLIDPQGEVIGFYASGVNPFDEEIVNKLD